MKETYTIQEVISFITSLPFQKFSHPYFSSDEYIYGDGQGHLCDESGYKLPQGEFWNLRMNTMKDGWYMVNDEKNIETLKNVEKPKNMSEIELYINDKLYKTVSEDDWNQEAIELNHILRMKGYHEQYGDLPGFEYPSSYVHVWINWDKKKIVVLSHKKRTQFKDKNGNVLYANDIVNYNDTIHPIQSHFSAKPFNEGYYIREVFHHPGGDSWTDTNIDETNIAYITKVKDVLDFSEHHWNSPKKFDINTL